MASEATVPAPSGRQDDKVATFNKTVPTRIQVRAETSFGVVASDDQQQPIYAMVAAPAGSHSLYSAKRMCGDWYAEFTAGRRMSCAAAETQAEAIRAAADRLAA